MAINETEQNHISKFFSENSEQIEKWLRESAPEDLVKKINQATASKTQTQSTLCVSHNEKRQSVTSELFQQWLAVPPPAKQDQGNKFRKHLEELDEGELFMELIRDVANELDIDVLCHKILVNVGLLTHADRGSLFLTKTQSSPKVLVAKLFDVSKDTALDDALAKAKSEEIVIPFGVGIAGLVAQTKQVINIKEAYDDPRFNSEIDQKTGYKTNAILSLPILNYEEEVIGVAQIINKTNGLNEFNDHDVEVFKRYLTFCGIGIQNAQLFETSVLEYNRNQILLNLARSIFEEQNNLECLVTKIMTEAQELLKCERCAVFLLDWECCESSHLERLLDRPTTSDKYSEVKDGPSEKRNFLQKHSSKAQSITQSASVDFDSTANIRFSKVFEMGKSNKSASILKPSIEDVNSSTLAQIASYVAATGEILNIKNITEWLKNQKDQILIYEDDEIVNNSKSILSMPIINGQKNVIGVLVYVHESGSHFTNSDIAIFEAFAIFCGLGIHNTTMYESACKLMAKQKVALECLSYHATASQDQTMKLANDVIQSAESFKLFSFTFTDFELTDDDTCRATIRMFVECNLVSQFRIPYDVLCRWILSVKKNYRPVKYHNWRHALNVAQTMFAMMKTGKMERFMDDLEILGLLVACLCHDLDHRGTNNAFQLKTDSPLAILYSTSTMEHHHFDQCVMILNSEGNNIFQTMSPDDYRKVMNVVESAILSTDLAMYFKKRQRFLELIDNGEFDWQSKDKKELLCGMMITACDVSAIAKPWEVQHKIAKLVADEFFDQGDLEKLQLNTQPIAMMDRERKDELPKMQVDFIDMICLPLYRVLAETFPWISPLYEGTLENRKNWQDLAEKVEMGLTWIDHDTIDKPIEGFSGLAEEIKEIELTVTTLHCQHDTESQNSPPHERRPRFSSLKKSAGLPKSVKSRLNLIKNQSEKEKDKKEVEEETKPSVNATENQQDVSVDKKMKASKKNSKICQLL